VAEDVGSLQLQAQLDGPRAAQVVEGYFHSQAFDVYAGDQSFAAEVHDVQQVQFPEGKPRW